MRDAQASAPAPSFLGFVPFVLTMAALQAMGALSIDAMLPNLPAIGATFGLPQENQRQLVITAYLLGLGCAQIPYGPMADRFGRRPVLLFGMAFYIVFSILAAFAPSFALLVAARFLQGVGAAATRALPISIIRDCYSGRQMARVMSIILLVFLAVPMAAPSLGQAISLFASWRWVFGALALFSMGVFAWTALKLPETLHPEDRTPIDLRRMAHNFAVALRSRPGMGYAVAMTFVSGALFGFLNAVQQVFSDVFKAAPLFPLMFALMAGCMAVASLLNARLVGRLGMRQLSHAALIAFIGVSTVHAAIALGGHETLVAFAALQGGAMFCFGLMSGNFGAMAMEPLGHVAGAAASLQGALSLLGGSLIGWLIGQSFNGTAAPIAIGYAVCGVLALSAVLFAEQGRLFRPQHAGEGALAIHFE